MLEQIKGIDRSSGQCSRLGLDLDLDLGLEWGMGLLLCCREGGRDCGGRRDSGRGSGSGSLSGRDPEGRGGRSGGGSGGRRSLAPQRRPR